MSQILSEHDCSNKKFRKCVVEDHKCVNCKRFFIKEGEWIKGKCDECNTLTQIQVDHVYNDTEFRGDCKECIEINNNETVSKLYQDLVWSCDSDTPYDEIKEIEESALEKIVNLPKNQLKHILRSMNRGIER